ncbi:MAG TPA: HYR domain-containing protein [Saprospiraceae bacterium]|nr:HYR domain-containing protein [Saprospiraceae bacterium]
MQSVSVFDNIAPSLNCPSNTTVTCAIDTGAAPLVTFTDNCLVGTRTALYSSSRSAGTCRDSFTLFRKYTAMDTCGNTSICVQSVAVFDNIAPSLNCPDDITVTCAIDTGAAPLVTFTDNCLVGTRAALYSSSRSAGTCRDSFTLFRKYTAMDTCGNTSVCVQSVSVFDNIAPSLNCPSNTTVTCAIDTGAAPLVTFTDNCLVGTRTALYSSSRSAGTCRDSFTLFRKYTAMDTCGNTSICVQSVAVFDNIAPSLNCPSNITLTCQSDTSTQSTGYPTVLESCSDTIKQITWTNLTSPGICNDNYIIRRNFTAIDSCNNISNCTQLITLQDTTKPNAICKNLTLIYNSGHYVVINTDSINNGSYDNCTDENNLYFNLSKDTIFCNRGSSYDTVTLYVQDLCGNIDSCQSIITLIDILAPEISCPSNTTIQLDECECFADLLSSAPISNYINATDNCDINVDILQISPSDISLDSIPPGIHEFTFVAVDDFGNKDSCSFQITVLGSPPAQIACNGHLNLSLNENCEASVTANSLILGRTCEEKYYNITLKNANGTIIPNLLTKDYLGQTITATVSYKCAANTCWSSIFIEDKLAPKLICSIDTIQCGEQIEKIHGPKVIESCSPFKLTTLSEQEVRLDCDPNFYGINIRTYRAEDSSGNQSNICLDTTYIKRIPFNEIAIANAFITISYSSNFKKDKNGNPHPEETGSPFYKNINLLNLTSLQCNLLINYTDYVFSNSPCKTKIIRTWTIREWWCNQELQKTLLQQIEIKDDIKPKISSAIPTIEVHPTFTENCMATIIIPEIQAQDEFSGLEKIQFRIDGQEVPYTPHQLVSIAFGLHQFSFIAFDYCGNTDTLSFNQDIVDHEAPTVVCKSKIVATINQNENNPIPASSFDNGSFDNCQITKMEVSKLDSSSCGTASWSDQILICCGDIGKDIMVQFRVTDKNGNSNTCMSRVQVQDKRQPTVIPLPDITVDCSLFNNNSFTSEIFGKFAFSETDRMQINIDPQFKPSYNSTAKDGLISNSCDINILESIDSSHFNNCFQGYLLRKFNIYNSSGLIATHSQKISSYNLVNPIDSSKIIWPQDFDTFDICDLNLLDPRLIVNTNIKEPKPINHSCSNLAFSYKDCIFNSINSNGCNKIARIWKAIDWCQQNQNKFTVYSDTQFITIKNNIPPIIESCQDTVICNFSKSCNPISIPISINSFDDCSADQDLKYNIYIDINQDKIIDYKTTTLGKNLINYEFPIGKHSVYWEVSDQCGNISSCSNTITVKNCVTPTVYCKTEFKVNLMSIDSNHNGHNDPYPIDNETSKIYARFLDLGSNHPCGGPVQFSFSKNPLDTVRVYDCSHLGSIVTEELWVTDQFGNQSFCNVRITIEDTNSQLICPPQSLINISGRISTESDAGLQNTEILSNSSTNKTITNENGEYALAPMMSGESLYVKPLKNNDWLNGVTTADIVKIQKHILGQEIFSRPYQYIAADVNRNGNISTRDIVELRKLILGITTEIPENTSWRFINSDYKFNAPEEGLENYIPYQYTFNKIIQSTKLNFTAVKVGDLNGNALTNLKNKSESRSNQPVYIRINDLHFTAGDSNSVDFSIININDLKGLQFSIDFNPNQLELLEFVPGSLPNLTTENFSLNKMKDGIITFSYDGLLKNNEKLFSLKLKSFSDLRISEVLTINSKITTSLAFNDQDEFEALPQFILNNAQDSEFSVSFNKPNPWGSETEIGIYIPENSTIEMKILDSYGRIIYNEKKEMVAGYNRWKLSSTDINSSGLYFYQVQYKGKIITKMMMFNK